MDIESALSQINNMLENEETNEKFKGIVDMLTKSGLGEDSTDSGSEHDSNAINSIDSPSKPAASDDSVSSLVGLLSALGGSGGGNAAPKPKVEKSNSGGGLGDLSSILGQASKLFGNSKVTNEQRLALLDGIEPFLKDERRAKVNTSKQILKIAGIAKLFESLDL